MSVQENPNARFQQWVEEVYTPWFEAAAASGDNGNPPPPPVFGD